MRTVGAVGNDGPVDTAGETVAVVGIGADGWAGLTEAGRAAVRSRRCSSAARGSSTWCRAHRRRRIRGRRRCCRAAGSVRRARRPPGVRAGQRRPDVHGIGATLARLLGPSGCTCCRTRRRCRWPARGWAGRSSRRGGQRRRPGRWPGSAWRSPPARLLVLSEDGATPGRSPRCSPTPVRPAALTVLAVARRPGRDPRRRPGARLGAPAGRPVERRRRLVRRGRRGAGPGRGPRPARRRLRPRRRSSPSARSAPSRWPSSLRGPATAVGRRRGQRLDRDRVAARAPRRAGRSRSRPTTAGPRGSGQRRGARRARAAGGAAGRRRRSPACPSPGRGLHRRWAHPDPGVLETCWAALRPGGRLVANAVTLEAEQAVASPRRDLARRRPGPARGPAPHRSAGSGRGRRPRCP